MLIDTHCHLNLMVKKSFDSRLTHEEKQAIDQVVLSAQENNVKNIVTVGTNLAESQNSVEIAQLHDSVYASVGLHPNDITPAWQHEFKAIQNLIKTDTQNRIVAIGECGLDLYRSPENLSLQQDVFKAQIELALTHNLAIIVHSREAPEETWEIIDQFVHEDNLRLVLHCFSGTQDYAYEAIKNDFYLGISCVLTYPRNDVLRDILRVHGLGNIVLETDAPFLPPQEFRGQKNSPTHIKTLAEYISNFLKLDLEEVANITTHNAQNLFKLDNLK